MMRITLFFLILGLVQVSASVYSQQTNLSVKLEKVKIEEVLKNIEDQSNFYFLFRSDHLKDVPVVDIDLKGASVEQILDKVLVPYGFSYEIDDRIVVIKKNGETTSLNDFRQQQGDRTVRGAVTDSQGNTLPGVTVIVKGTTTGTITAFDGTYTLSGVPANAILLFSFVGMESLEVEVNNRSQLNVTMREQTIGIEEVIAVGYGTMKKLDVSGSIVSASAEVLREVPSVNASQALQGRLPGIEMSQTSTRPGATMQIRIRGERSLNATNDPLIVVDGIPFAGSINDISPNDIKSIDILKDASSTAIYGSRGANGVILVTTFRGNANTKASISYNGYYGVKTVAKEYPVYNGEEFQAFKHATVNSSYKDQYTPLEQEMIAAGKETDWQDLMYSNAMVTNHDVSISTGTDKGAYLFGGSYYNETAVLPGQEYTRYSLRTAVDQEIGKYIKIGLSSQNSYAITAGDSASVMNNIITLSPLMPAFNDDGSIREIPTVGHVDTYYNPLLLKNSKLWQEKRKRYATFNSLFGEVKLTDFLRYRLNLGLSHYSENYGNFYGSLTPFKNGSISSATVQNKHFTSWTAENLLFFDQVFAEKHRANATLMYSAEQSEFSQSQMDADNISADYLLWYNLGLADGAKTIDAKDQAYYKRGLKSLMARVMYAFEDRYTLTATWRRDGASVLASGHKWHNYAAFSAGWNIANESFLKDANAVDQLKLRVGYGQTSNQAIDAYSTLGRLSQVPYNFGSNLVYGAYVTDLPNPGLGWEYTKNYNLGIDFGFMKNRLTGYIDLYKQKTSDVLYAVQLPQSSGVSNKIWQNIGATENKGFEFALSAQIIKPHEKGGFGWDMDFNIYANRNKIVALNSGVTQDIGNGFFVGQPINVIYDYVKLGIIQENEAPYLGTYAAGKIKVDDIGGGPNGEPDGQITASGDRRILGTFEPDFAGGFSTRLYYKNFDLSIVSFFKSGGMLVSTMHMPHSYLSTNNGRRNSIKVNYWTPENPSGTYPQPGNQNSAEQDDWGSTLGYFDASFWKVRTISLGYTFDPKLLANIGCRDVRVYFTCLNPFTMFSPYMDAGGLDPEATGSGPQGANTSLRGGLTDRILSIGANTPPTRNFLIGLNVKF
ncbi:TonB-dependent receptor [Gaoshiqia sp. Z1-71]|uniref:TonB-dependent receptor n=1 Tax=Gaoshiqia hydrogeniformans TaxID=3290090 RepID=UPI003BF8B0EB